MGDPGGVLPLTTGLNDDVLGLSLSIYDIELALYFRDLALRISKPDVMSGSRFGLLLADDLSTRFLDGCLTNVDALIEFGKGLVLIRIYATAAVSSKINCVV